MPRNNLDDEISRLQQDIFDIRSGGRAGGGGGGGGASDIRDINPAKPGQPDQQALQQDQPAQQDQRAFSFEQATELAKKLGIKSAEGRIKILENIQDDKIRKIANDAVVAEQAVQDKEKGIAAFERDNKSFARSNMQNSSNKLQGGQVSVPKRRAVGGNKEFITVGGRRAFEIKDFLPVVGNIPEGSSVFASARKPPTLEELRRIQEFGKPAVQPIVETSPFNFTNRPGAKGRIVTPGEPAIPSREQRKFAQEREIELLKALSKNTPTKPGGRITAAERKAQAVTDRVKKRELERVQDKTEEQKRELQGVNDRIIARKENVAASSPRLMGGADKRGGKILEKGFAAATAATAANQSLNNQAFILNDQAFKVNLLGGITNTLAGYVKAIGINPRDLGLNESAKIDIFQQSVFSQLMEVLRQQKGVQTDGDAARAIKTFASLDMQTKEGAQFVVNYLRTMNSRIIMKSNFEAKFIRDLGLQGKNFNPGAQAQMVLAWNDIMKKTPASLELNREGGGKQIVTFQTFKDAAKRKAKSLNKSVTDEDILKRWQGLV